MLQIPEPPPGRGHKVKKVARRVSNKLTCTLHGERVHVFARGVVHRKGGSNRCLTETVEVGDLVIKVSEFKGKDLNR